MNNLELIAELDKRLELINEQWAQEVASLLEKHNEGSAKFEKESKRLNKKYAAMTARVMVLREEVYSNEAKKQDEEYEAQFVDVLREEDKSELDEFGRPKHMIWKDGRWQPRKKKTEQQDK